MSFELNETENTTKNCRMQLKLPDESAIWFPGIYLKELKGAYINMKSYIYCIILFI